MNVVVAVPVDENIASFIGKRGSANSITFYNRKSGKDVIVALFPSQEEDKIYSLAESLLIASKIVLSTKIIDKKFGEALVASTLMKKKIIFTDDNDVSGLAKGLGTFDFRVAGKESIMESILSADESGKSQQENARVDIDKAFPVKGIGTVVLGIVTRGTIKQHDRLFHTSGKEVLVRSMQSQDEDIGSAETGTRIGISLKDISDEEVSKGDLLSARAIPASREIKVSFVQSAAAKERIEEKGSYGLVSNFSYVECAVKKVGGDMLELELKSAIPAEAGEEVLLIRKDAPRIFAYGKVIEAHA